MTPETFAYTLPHHGLSLFSKLHANQGWLLSSTGKGGIIGVTESNNVCILLTSIIQELSRSHIQNQTKYLSHFYLLLWGYIKALPANQEYAETCEQECNKDTNPHVSGEGRQQAEAALLRGPVFAQNEADSSLHEGGSHIHKLLSDSSEGQWGYSQVSFLRVSTHRVSYFM